MNRPTLVAGALTVSLLGFSGCSSVRAEDTPTSPALDRIERAVDGVERAAAAVVAGVASGTVDPGARGADLLAAFTRLNLVVGRMDRLLTRLPEVPPEPELTADGAPVEGLVVDGAPPGAPGAVGMAAPAASAPGAKATRTESSMARTSTAGSAPASAATAPPASTTSSSSSAASAPDKTGIASIDKFLATTATLSTQLTDCQTRLESARTKLTSSLGLAKKFKPEDAKAALKEKLGTGYKITLGNPPGVVPGPDAKDPAIVTDLKAAIVDLVAVQKALPGIVSSASTLAQQGAAIPTQAKSELTALGPMKGAEAVAKVAKSVKTVTKIPKDAKELGDEVATWTKVLGG